jgi:hypothetical protein
LKKVSFPVILVGLLLLAVPVVIPACNIGDEVVEVDKEVSIPPLDAARPSRTETATFAMG